MTDTRQTLAVRPIAAWGVIVVAVLALDFALRDAATRRLALQAVLLAMAGGEGLGAFMQIFRARQMGGLTGRRYDAAYHGVVQDFGFYNLAVAVMLALCALDPRRNVAVLIGVIILYAVHGGTHLLRSFGRYYGGEAPVATRPRQFELRDGLPLLVALVAVLLFYPSR